MRPDAPRVTPSRIRAAAAAAAAVPLEEPACPPGDVSAHRHGPVFAAAPRCPRVGRQRQVRGQLPRQMQSGGVRRDRALRTDRPGRLRLLPGLRRRQRGALLPHGVGDARGEVRTGIILRLLQG